LLAEQLVLFPPRCQVSDRGHPIPLLTIAFATSEHELVRKIGRVPGPGNKMIHFTAARGNPTRAVKTETILQVCQEWPDAKQDESVELSYRFREYKLLELIIAYTPLSDEI
jgi:hypothetical protein